MRFSPSISPTKFLAAITLSVFACYAAVAQADWASLDPENSSVNFVSTKLKDISEVHYFKSMNGAISDEGAVTINIDAASINSGIEIRDGRMKEFLFAIADYPQITISAQVDLAALKPGVSRMEIPATLGLKGSDTAISLDAFVSVTESSVSVSSAKPVILFASQVGLSEGVAKLAELAGGIAVGGSVPVTFSLNFER